MYWSVLFSTIFQNLGLTALPTGDYGKFHQGDSYVIYSASEFGSTGGVNEKVRKLGYSFYWVKTWFLPIFWIFQGRWKAKLPVFLSIPSSFCIPKESLQLTSHSTLLQLQKWQQQLYWWLFPEPYDRHATEIDRQGQKLHAQTVLEEESLKILDEV